MARVRVVQLDCSKRRQTVLPARAASSFPAKRLRCSRIASQKPLRAARRLFKATASLECGMKTAIRIVHGRCSATISSDRLANQRMTINSSVPSARNGTRIIKAEVSQSTASRSLAPRGQLPDLGGSSQYFSLRADLPCSPARSRLTVAEVGKTCLLKASRGFDAGIPQ